MNRYFANYRWRKGIPYGVAPLESAEWGQNETAYKIVIDPYYKRISIEKYALGKFNRLIYDSNLFDFRLLKPAEQIGWQSELLNEKTTQVQCLIRNQDDRIVLLERHVFEKHLCRECHLHSPSGIFLSIHKMFYTTLGDPFNGVILYDANDHIVMRKYYEADDKGEFTSLLKEQWVFEESDNTINAI